jgi:hypothetical protein
VIGDVIAEVSGGRKFDFDVERALFAMVANRACAPASKLLCGRPVTSKHPFHSSQQTSPGARLTPSGRSTSRRSIGATSSRKVGFAPIVAFGFYLGKRIGSRSTIAWSASTVAESKA